MNINDVRESATIFPRPCKLTFWPWKWCLSHLWRGLPVCQFWSSLASLFSSYSRCTRQTDMTSDVVRQTSDKQKASLNAPA